MKVNIVGRNVKVTPAMHDYARDRAERLDKYFVGIQHVNLVMDVHGLVHEVEAVAMLGQGAKLVGKAEAEDMYAAIDMAESKLQKQIRRFHARLKAHRERRRISDGRPVDAEQEEKTYEQVVRELLEEEKEN